MIAKMINELNTLWQENNLVIVGIDGCGGSGKSTLARQIQQQLGNVSVVHMDDFYLPSERRLEGTAADKPIGADFDWQRMRDEVLLPLKYGKEATYQVYDWEKDRLQVGFTVAPKGIVVIEGVYSTREELREFYDLRIWVDCPYELRLSRGLERDGEEAYDQWVDDWMVAEEKYVNEHSSREVADIIITGY